MKLYDRLTQEASGINTECPVCGKPLTRSTCIINQQLAVCNRARCLSILSRELSTRLSVALTALEEFVPESFEALMDHEEE
jgi:hypothetical protein